MSNYAISSLKINANKRESLRNPIRVYLRPFAVNFPSDFETIQLRAIRVLRGQDSLHPPWLLSTPTFVRGTANERK